MTTKTCVQCQCDLPLTDFRALSDTYRQAKCRECERAYGRAYMVEYRKKRKAERLIKSAGGIPTTIGGPDIWETVRGIEARLQKIEAALTKPTET